MNQADNTRPFKATLDIGATGVNRLDLRDMLQNACDELDVFCDMNVVQGNIYELRLCSAEDHDRLMAIVGPQIEERTDIRDARIERMMERYKNKKPVDDDWDREREREYGHGRVRDRSRDFDFER